MAWVGTAPFGPGSAALPLSRSLGCGQEISVLETGKFGVPGCLAIVIWKRMISGSRTIACVM
jgi:hypothetical protein